MGAFSLLYMGGYERQIHLGGIIDKSHSKIIHVCSLNPGFWLVILVR